MNLMAGLSAALFVICFVMGAGLIQNRNRISIMQNDITQLNTAYRNLFVQMSSDGTAQVFAAQPDDPDGTVPAQFGLNEPAVPQPSPTGAAPDGTAGVPDNYVPIVNTSADYPDDDEIPSGTDMDETADGSPNGNIPDEILVVDETSPEEETLPEAYTIQPGDSLIEISLRFYGNTSMMDEILALNGIANADKIISGKTIALPRP
jgi:nucleoid-associated protein YgaU